MKKFKKINDFYLLFGFITKNEVNDKKDWDQISKISNKKFWIERFHIISKTSFNQELTETKKMNKWKKFKMIWKKLCTNNELQKKNENWSKYYHFKNHLWEIRNKMNLQCEKVWENIIKMI